MSERSSTGTGSSTSQKSSCQFQKVADQFFRDFSRLIAKWPLIFCLAPLSISVGLGTGVYFQRRVFESTVRSDNQVTNYLPDNVDSIENWRQLTKLFDFERETATRGVYDFFKRSYAYVILVDKGADKNALNDSNLRVAKEIIREIKKIRLHLNDLVDVGWQQMCQKIFPSSSLCLEHPLVTLLDSAPGNNRTGASSNVSLSVLIQNILHYPTFQLGNVTVDNSLMFGSVVADGRGYIRRAQALRLPFVLQQAENDERRKLNYLWQKEFLNLMKSLRHPSLGIYYTTSISLTDQIDQNGKMLVQYLPVVFCILIAFSVFCCCSTDWVLSQPWLGVCGILTAAQAVVAAVGILLYCGFPFLQMVFIMPFLILSVSADNAFLVLSCWRNTHPLIPIEERVAQSVGGTSVSIMITALTDGLSFAVGSVSQFPAVRLFCTYCALAILCAFIYQMTFFTACLALCGRREAANRHCLIFLKVQPKSESGSKSFLYQIFCAGGYFSQTTSSHKRIPLRLHSHVMTEFFGRHLANVLCSTVYKILIILIYFGYLTSAVWGVVHLKIGLQLQNLVPYDSYVAHERGISDVHFSAYGSHAFVVITECLHYSDEQNRKRLSELYRSLISTDYTSGGEFWLHDIPLSSLITSATRSGFSNNASFTVKDDYTTDNNDFDNGDKDNGDKDNLEKLFIQNLNENVLSVGEYRKFRNDFKFDENHTRILATKFYVRLKNAGSTNLTKIVHELRKKFQRFAFQGFVFDPTFLLVDQEEATVRCVLQDVFIAVGVMIAITLLFIPKLLCAVWIGLSILSINVGVIGYLSLWNVRLDIVSMITTVMSVGLSVDYVAHVTYHYLVVHTSDSKLRMHKTLRHVAVPTVQSAISTILGISILAFVDSYMIRTFVKTVILVVSLGVMHGLLFLPVALALFVPADQFLESFGHYDKVREYLATNLNLSKYFGAVPIGNKRMVSYFVRSNSPSPDGAASVSGDTVILPISPHSLSMNMHLDPFARRQRNMSSLRLSSNLDLANLDINPNPTDTSRFSSMTLPGAVDIDAGGLYGFLKFKNTAKTMTSPLSSTNWIRAHSTVSQSIQTFYCALEKNINAIPPGSHGNGAVDDEEPKSEESCSSRSSDNAQGSTQRLFSRKRQPRLNFPPPPLEGIAQSASVSTSDHHYYDAPATGSNSSCYHDNDNGAAENGAVNEGLRYFEGRPKVDPPLPPVAFRRHRYHSDYGSRDKRIYVDSSHVTPVIDKVQTPCSPPTDKRNLHNKRDFTQSQMVQIILNGNLGSRSALTKSISLDNIDKSLQSLADSDFFGNVQGGDNDLDRKADEGNTKMAPGPSPSKRAKPLKPARTVQPSKTLMTFKSSKSPQKSLSNTVDNKNDENITDNVSPSQQTNGSNLSTSML